MRAFRAAAALLSALIALAPLTEAAAAAAAIPNDDEGFTQLLGQRLRAALPGASIKEITPLVVSITAAGGKPVGELSLGRIKDFCASNSPNACQTAIGQFVAGASSMVRDATAPPSKTMIRLVIRPAAEVDPIAAAQTAHGGPALILRDFAPGLRMIVVLDSVQSVRYMTQADLQALKLTEDSAIDLGRANLQKVLKPLQSALKTLPSGHIGQLHDSLYESSRLLLTAEWAPVEKAGNDKLVVSIPAPNILLYADGSDPATIDALRGLTQEAVKKSPRALSDAVFAWSGGAWVALAP